MPPGTRPHTASAQRGTNVAVSKRTRFALQVQKPTGEEGTEGGSKESTVSGMDLGVSPSTVNPGGGLRSPRGGGEVLVDLAVRLHEGDEEQVGRVGWMGRSHGKGWAGQGVEGRGGEHRLGREPRV